MGSVRQNAPPGFAILSGLRRRGQLHVLGLLPGSAPLVNRRQGQTTRQAGGCGPTVHPCQFKRHQRQRQVFRTRDEAAVLRLHKDGRDPRRIERLQQFGLGRCPLMRISAAVGHQPRHRTAGHRSCRLHQHLKVVTVGKSPLNLTRGIGRKRPQQFRLDGGGSGSHVLTPLGSGRLRSGHTILPSHDRQVCDVRHKGL